MDTPWGSAQSVDIIADGIVWVTTASHGGALLDPGRTAAMPAFMAGKPWCGNSSSYEEDCEWCMPALFFEQEFRAFYLQRGRTDIEQIITSAKNTLRHWHPEAYEAFYDVTLKPGESHRRDKQQFIIDNKDNWIVAAAWGDWKADVPKGMVGVCARRGAPEIPGAPKERYFLVSATEYSATSSPFGFVIDLDWHQDIQPLT
jgi:hypothetical protein